MATHSDGKATGKQSDQRPSKTILRRTLVLMAVCGIAAFIVLAVKLYDIQIKDHEYYAEQALENQTRDTVVTASRGTIYDANGKVLAMSASVDTVYVAPYETDRNGEDKDLIANGLSEILGVDRDRIRSKLDNKNSWYETVKRKIEGDIAEKVRLFMKENNLKSIHLETDTKRYYPYSSRACHIIGFVGDDNYGLNGIELTYNQYLEGTDGRIVRLKNAKGTDMLFSDFEDYYDAKNGDDIELTIDASIQFYVEKYLAQAIQDYEVQNGGACIVMRPKTGEILAMASLNSYDLNNFLDVSEEEQTKLDLITDPDEKKAEYNLALQNQQRNKSLTDTYEPGSVFKIITCAMALEENVVSLDDTFYCGGSIDVLGREPVKCWKTAGHGSQTLTQAMQHSCNVALVNIGLKVGEQTFYDYIDAFGLREKTGIDLPGESGSLWWPDSVFENPDNLSQLAAASFGQTFNITPLQMITAVSAVVNGGNLMEPYIVKQVTDADGNIVVDNEPTAVRQVLSADTSAKMCEILRAVVCDEGGTGKNAYVAGYKVGGKTGTSTNTVGIAEGEPKKYIVSFCGIAPTDDPQVAILLLLDNPTSKTVYVSGGNMAAPVVGHILSEVLPYLGIQPEYSEEELETLDVTMPKLVGMTVDEATQSLEKLGLTVRLLGDGERITDQLPSLNAAIAPGSQIILYAGEYKSSETVAVPNLYGKSYASAKSALENAGLFIKSGGTLSSSPHSVVTTQSVPANEEVKMGTIIEVTLVDDSIKGFY